MEARAGPNIRDNIIRLQIESGISATRGFLILPTVTLEPIDPFVTMTFAISRPMWNFPMPSGEEGGQAPAEINCSSRHAATKAAMARRFMRFYTEATPEGLSTVSQRPQLFRRCFDEFGDATPLVPVLDVEVAFVVDSAAVGGGEDAFFPVLRWDAEISALGFNRVVAEDA